MKLRKISSTSAIFSTAVRKQSEISLQKAHVLVLGAGRVGKTCLVLRLLQEDIPTGHKQTVEDFYHLTLTNKPDKDEPAFKADVTIQDMSGSLEFPAMRRLAIRKSSGIILVHALDNPSSWRQVERLREEIREAREDRVPVTVVGNKMDLYGSDETVEAEEIWKQVTGQWGDSYVEASAKCDPDITRVFLPLLRSCGLFHVTSYDLRKCALERRRSEPAMQHRLSAVPTASSDASSSNDRRGKSCVIS